MLGRIEPNFNRSQLNPTLVININRNHISRKPSHNAEPITLWAPITIHSERGCDSEYDK